MTVPKLCSTWLGWVWKTIDMGLLFYGFAGSISFLDFSISTLVLILYFQILTALTESTNNAKLVATLPNFENNIAKAIEKPFPPKVIHALLVVQSRLNAVRVKPQLPPLGTSSPAPAKSFIKTAGTKQLVYQLSDNDDVSS